MLLEVIETFKKLSDGSILHPGDVIDVSEEKGNLLVKNGRVRPQPLPRCGDCQHFERDSINPGSGAGDCKMFLLPDERRQIARYPMQGPKNETCFEGETP